MQAGTRTHVDTGTEPESRSDPGVSVCESCPGRSVFLESGNTEGWISTDLTVDVVQ